MITKTLEPVYRSTLVKNQMFNSLTEVKTYELVALLIEHGVANSDTAADVATRLVAHAAAFADILTTTPTSRPSARKLNRAKPRAAKKNTRPASVEDALKHQAGLNASVKPEPTAEEIANLEQQAAK